MRMLLGTLALLTLPAALYAQETTPAPKSTMKKPMAASMAKAPTASDDMLIAKERSMLEAIEKHDADAFKALVVEDALSADPNGFSKVSEFIPMISQMTMTDWKMNDPHVVHVDANTAIVTYTWTGTATMPGMPTQDKPTYISTVWTNKGGKWLAVYHQETEAAPKK
jgi:ketosteroid isomerase-like protein